MVKILIADDDTKTRGMLNQFLAKYKCEIFEAKDGAETVELARARRPDIVLLDIYMPKKDGVDVLKELTPEMPRTMFVMITGNEDAVVARECLELGACDYVSKPINLEMLDEILAARINRP